MLASTLIKHLQKQIELHGDLPVQIGHPTEDYPVNAPVKGVDHIRKGSKSKQGRFGLYSYAAWPECIRLRARVS